MSTIDIRNITITLELDGVDYEVIYNYWKWESRDRSEQDEEIIEITKVVPEADEETENKLYELLWEVY